MQGPGITLFVEEKNVRKVASIVSDTRHGASFDDMTQVAEVE
jgi:hypothetical protein